MPVQKTEHVTTFNQASIGLVAVTDDDNIVRGYQVQIKDVIENHVYVFPITRVHVKDEIREMFNQVPDIGFPVLRDA